MQIFEQLRPLLKSIDPEISQLWNDYGQEIENIKIVSNKDELLSVLSAYLNIIGELQIKRKHKDSIPYFDKALFLLENNSVILESSIYNKYYESLLVAKISAHIYAHETNMAYKVAKTLKKKYPMSEYTSLYWQTLFCTPILVCIIICIGIIAGFFNLDIYSFISLLSTFLFACIYLIQKEILYLIYSIIFSIMFIISILL